ncbi:MAG: hypothetical protein ABIU84_13975, partial [Thermoanaerobaculia bacterium]
MRPLTSSAVLVVALAGSFLPSSAQPEAVRKRLLGPGTASSDVANDASFSPDGEWVVARWTFPNEYNRSLYAVRRDGSQMHQISSDTSAVDVDSFVITPDSRYVVYAALLLADDRMELRSVPISGPAVNVRLSPSWTSGFGVEDYEISRDSSRVVMSGHFDDPDTLQIYSAPIAGPTGATVQLNPPPVLNGEVYEFEISPDSSRVVFSGD